MFKWELDRLVFFAYSVLMCNCCRASMWHAHCIHMEIISSSYVAHFHRILICVIHQCIVRVCLAKSTTTNTNKKLAASEQLTTNTTVTSAQVQNSNYVLSIYFRRMLTKSQSMKHRLQIWSVFMRFNSKAIKSCTCCTCRLGFPTHLLHMFLGVFRYRGLMR